MRLETSFLHEAANARKCAELLAQTPELRDDIYVPKVFGKGEGYPESDRVMVMEWVDGCRLNDKAQLQAWGLNLRDVMDLAVSLNGAMTFSWGFLHSDPHPGNILVRPHPTKKGKPQLVSPRILSQEADSRSFLTTAYTLRSGSRSAKSTLRYGGPCLS